MLCSLVFMSIFTINKLSGKVEGCGGMMEANNGTLVLEPSYRPCLWVITLKNTTGVRLEISPLMLTSILVIPQQNLDDQNLKSVWINGSKEVIYMFDAKILAIMAPNRSENSNLSWTGLVLDFERVSIRMKFVNDSKGTLEWKHKRDGREKIFWTFHQRTDGQIRWNLETPLPTCYSLDPCESLYFSVLEIMSHGMINEILMACEGSSKSSINVTKGSQVWIFLHVNAPMVATTSLEVTWKYAEHLNRNTKGIIGGLELGSGVVVVPFSSTQLQIKGSSNVFGLAFDWSSNRIYWLPHESGIIGANLDGSDTVTLLPDQSDSDLRGMAIEPITGNFYFGNRSSKTIRVCNNNADRCSTIASSSDLSKVWDVAVHWSQGFLFWSIRDRTLVRANLDGSNRKVLLNRTSVTGIAVEVEENRLYWGIWNGIESCDLDGGDIRRLPNVNTDTLDVVIEEDKVYYSSWKEPRIYVISKFGSNFKSVAYLPAYAWYIDVYGKTISRLPRNPCQNRSCAHLCVLTSPLSFRCLCPDGEKLASDRITCTA